MANLQTSTSVGALVAVLTATSAAAAEIEPTLITIGTGTKTGVYYPVGGAICDLVNVGRWEHGVRCIAETSNGSVANLNDLLAGSIDFAMVQSDWHYRAHTGGGDFARTEPNQPVRSVMSLYAEPFTLVARREAQISGIDDLMGKRVNIGEPGAGRRATMDVVMGALGWSRGDFTVAAEIPIDDQVRALCDGDLDAVTFVIGHPNRVIEEMVAACGADLVPVTGPVIDQLVDNTDYYRKTFIPDDLYPGIDDPTPTFGLSATLITTSQTDNHVVNVVVRAVFENLGSFRNMHPVLADLNAAEMQTEGLVSPLHAGAQLFFWGHREESSTNGATTQTAGNTGN